MDALQLDKQYTYADYLTWGDESRYELIEGVPYLMSPAPGRKHQRVSMELSRQLAGFLEGKPCRVFAAPFDVRLNAADRDDTVVQPDLLVVCDRSKLDERGCAGAPDLVIEILSPHSGARDRVEKLNLYLRAGVREYWIVDPDNAIVSVQILENGKYIANAYAAPDGAPVHVLDGCMIDLTKVFAE